MNPRLALRGMVCLLLLASACHEVAGSVPPPSGVIAASSATPPLPAPLPPTVAPTPSISCFRLEDTGVEISAGIGTSFAWSHNGQWLAVTDGVPFYHVAIWVLPVGRWKDARQVLKMTSEDDIVLPGLAWSPDDTQLGFTLAKELYPGPGMTDVHMAQLDWRRGIVSRLSSEPAQLMDWSSQNRLLVIKDTSEYTGLWMLDLSSGRWTLLNEPLALRGNYRFPHWTSDEQVIIGYAVEKEPDRVNERNEVYVLDGKSNSWKRLPVQFITAGEGIPVLSPDGRRIAWIERYFRGWQSDWRIMLYDLPTGTTTELVSSASNRTFPWYALAWAPDSQRLAFVGHLRSPDYYEPNTVWILTLDQPCSDPDVLGAAPSPVAR